MSTKNQQNENQASWLATWLVTLGMSQTWANIIATAVVAAAAAVYAMSGTSCEMGSISTDGQSASLVLPESGWSLSVSQVQEHEEELQVAEQEEEAR